MAVAAGSRPVGDRLVTVFGGSGFIGRHVVRALARDGWRVRVAVRRPDMAGFLQPLGGVGQIVATQANIRYPESVAQALRGADAAINLVGVLFEGGKQTFQSLQVDGAKTIAEAARAAGVQRFVQISAIGANRESKAQYGQSKAAGEAAVLETFSDAVVLRPSIVFGPEDDFFNRFAAMARFSPFLPLVGSGRTLFQPVFVGDVARVAALAASGDIAGGPEPYELGGPEIVTFEHILRYVLELTGRNRALVNLPFGVARLQARALQLLPKPLLTVDQVTMLGYDNVVSEAAKAAGRTLEGLGVASTPMEAVVPGYLWRYRKTGQYERSRQEQARS